MADDLDVQRVFARFNAKPIVVRKRRRRLSLFPWTPMQQAAGAGASAVTADATTVTSDSITRTADES